MRADVKRNRSLLLAAAREVFAERGLDVSMDVIARRAGLGTGTAYRHFANKYVLANAIFDDTVDAIVANAERAQAGPHTPDTWGALRHVLEQILREQTSNRAVREIILADNQDDWAHHDSLLAPVRAALDQARAAGTVRTDVTFTDVQTILIMLCALTEQVGAAAPHLWRRYLPTMLEGLRPDINSLPGRPLSDDALRAAQVSGMLRYLPTERG